MERENMRTWAEISLDNLEHNYRALRACGGDARFLGVVKADAYGHGAVAVGKKLEELGADYLATATLDEAAVLREAGISLPILILGVTPAAFAGELVRLNLVQTVASMEQGRELSAALKEGEWVKVHLKLDTGMGRLGIDAHDPRKAADRLALLWNLPGLEVEGVFTHFSCADTDEEFTMAQFTRFLDTLECLREEYGLVPKIRHCAASAAVLNYPCTHLDMIRPGIALYGHYPHPSCEGLDGYGLLPVMTLKGRVAEVKELPAGAAVSYGADFTLGRDGRIAVLPVGYADGFHRSLSGKIEVLIRGRRAPQVGRICMDLCMVDVTHLPEVGPGDEFTLFGEELPLEELAQAAGTVSYELLCSVAPRVPRIH